MPSGAKKRKAAKKKKEQNTNFNSSSINDTNPQGNDDPKSQDERDSDGGEAHSPASQDHHHQEHPFNEENEEFEKSDQSSSLSEYKPVDGLTSDAQGSQKVGVQDESVVSIEREMDYEQGSESKYVSLKQVDSAKESHNGDDNGPSSSSSDDESHSLDKKLKEEAHISISDAALTPKEEFSEEVAQDSGTEKLVEKINGNSIAETYTSNDFTTPQVPMSEVVERVMKGVQFVDPAILDVIEPGLKNNEDKLLPKPNDAFTDLVPKKNEDKAFPVLDENVKVSANVVTSDVTKDEGKSSVHSTETTISTEKTQDSETLGSTVTGIEDKIPQSSGAHGSEASKGAIKTRDNETSEHAETEPIATSAPQVTQRTSWMNCCGLVDLFPSSNR